MVKPKTKNREKGKWWDEPLTVVPGCTEVSEGCANCWSREQAKRFGQDWTPRFHSAALDKIPKRGAPRVYAVWNDLFHEAVSNAEIAQAINAMWRCYYEGQGHLFMVLTKRIERAAEFFARAKRVSYIHGIPIDQPQGDQNAVPPNVALGVTVESQGHVERVSDMLAAWPGLTFASVDPMLTAVDIGEYLWACPAAQKDSLVIAGCESGPKRRPCDPAWLRSLRDQCAEAGVSFWLKQMEIDGRVRHRLDEFPPDLRVRQWFGEA